MLPLFSSLSQTTTKFPAASRATDGYVCDCVVYELTWNWLPSGAPEASKRRAWIL